MGCPVLPFREFPAGRLSESWFLAHQRDQLAAQFGVVIWPQLISVTAPIDHQQLAGLPFRVMKPAHC